MRKPVVGDVVNLCFSGRRVPAAVTAVWSDTCVNLFPLDYSLGYVPTSLVRQDESQESAAMPNTMTTEHLTWAWPPR